ncbi:hypothetical protein F511_33892 [Dorcoceras hygrometricum]|uniref:Dystroglycan-like n=1 Tax=Dorcoceras hygrometricum TaxID=472368 RepID=A0A2Z7B4S5_9LAMI|nr:hypothetical protein F511_33892 [Dorcoceras hygrometricum]
MSLFDLQDVCIVIGSLATLDLPMVVDLIGIYGLKGPYSTLTTTDLFLQALSVIPRGSWGDVARRFTMIRWGSLTKESRIWSWTGLAYLPQSTEKRRVLETPVGARHKCQRDYYLSSFFQFNLLSEMASVFITNALQVNFESVLGISDNDGMVNMFKALETTRLRGFLGCPSVLYEKELEQFFDIALVQDNDITCVISGKYVAISEDRFAGVFNLPTDGLIDLSEVPNHLVLQARSVFYKSEKPVQYSCKKRLLKYEFRLLNDILAKSITVKAGSFDVVTHERFLMMTDIHFGVKINWSKILFEVLKEMTDRTIKRAKGFAAQICVLLKGDPAVILGEAKTFPSLKILSEKTVNTYVATNKTIDGRGESNEEMKFLNSFILRRLPVLTSLIDISVKEEKVLTWSEIDSVQISLQRRLYIVAKYREFLLRKFLGSHRENFSFGQPWSAMALQNIDLLSIAHNAAVNELRKQNQAHVLQWTRSCCSILFEDIVPIGPVMGDVRIPRRIVDSVSYRIHIIDSVLPEPNVQVTPVVDSASVPTDCASLSPRNSDISLPSLHQSPSTDFSLHFTLEDIIQGAAIDVEHIPGVQTDTASLSIEIHEFKKTVHAQNALFTTDLADLRNEVKDLKAELSKDFDDKLAVIWNDLLEFRVGTKGQLASLGTNLSEFIAFVTKGRDDKKGEVSSSHGRGQPPPGDGGGSCSRSQPPPGDGGGSCSRSEPS